MMLKHLFTCAVVLSLVMRPIAAAHAADRAVGEKVDDATITAKVKTRLASERAKDLVGFEPRRISGHDEVTTPRSPFAPAGAPSTGANNAPLRASLTRSRRNPAAPPEHHNVEEAG